MGCMHMDDGSCAFGVPLQIPMHPEFSGWLLLFVDLWYAQTGLRITDNLQSNHMFRVYDRLAPTGWGDIQVPAFPLFHTDVAVPRGNPPSLIATSHDIPYSRQHNPSARMFTQAIHVLLVDTIIS